MVYRNRRGVVTLMLIFFIFFALFTVVIAGTALYGFETFDSTLSNLSGINIGNVSFEESYNDTIGRGLKTVISTFSTVSFALVLGMIIVMLVIGFKSSKDNKLWIVLDVFIIVVAFATSVYISIAFSSFINSSSTFLDIYSVDLQRTSTFLLNLPFVIAIIGAMIILVTYIPFKRKDPRVLEFN